MLAQDRSFWLRLFIVVAVIDIVHVTLSDVPAYGYKPLLMLSLGAYAWQQTRARQTPQTRALLFGLAFAWLGDVLLLFSGPGLFELGLGAFLVMQLLYSRAFLLDARRPSSRTWVLIGVVLAGIGALMARLFPLVPDALRLPVLLYMTAITAMTLTALCRREAVPPARFWPVFAGACLFVCSDYLLALERFGTPNAVVRFFVMPTYLLAQYLIVSGMLQPVAQSSGPPATQPA